MSIVSTHAKVVFYHVISTSRNRGYPSYPFAGVQELKAENIELKAHVTILHELMRAFISHMILSQPLDPF